jgi:hypothetical protein
LRGGEETKSRYTPRVNGKKNSSLRIMERMIACFESVMTCIDGENVSPEAFFKDMSVCGGIGKPLGTSNRRQATFGVQEGHHD